ncbi:MAG: GlsB/YeaQ/YmgE family stress response membrane protein [Candidatus Binatus sp.]|nr:GlsB/YeaQ/YmgE family stress response membrane protein [Candidatus Binatus sp.]MDO8431928.1 GlsB/YeaQ/YmgE family stress response membrane protein [Candidatus Binatus sp.]
MKLRTSIFYATCFLASALPAFAQDAASPEMPPSMGIIAWIMVGLIGGFLASKVVNRTGEGLLRDILLGIVGAFVGGLIFRAIGSAGVTGFNLWSILVAFVGAVVFLILYHAMFGRPRTRTV